MQVGFRELQPCFRLLAVALCAVFSAELSEAAPSKGSPPGGLVLPPIQRLAAEANGAVDGKAVECVDIRTGSPFEYRAQHLLPSGAIDETWAPDSTECCLGSPEGIREHVIPDGAGGAYAAWVDSRLEEPDIYLQRFTACGEAVSGWPLGGRVVCSARQSQYNLDAGPDGQGGVLLVWQDFRDERSTIYVQRITESGEPAPGWPEGGMAPAPGGREQAAPCVAPDGSGGSFVFWQERDGGGLGLRVQRVTGGGGIASGWPPGGVLLVPGSQRVAGLKARNDASGRVTVIWQCALGSASETLQLAGLDIGPVPGSDWAAAAITLVSGASLISDATLLRASDGGLLVGWSEMNSSQIAVKLLRLAEGGSIATSWPATGATVVASGASLSAPALLSDGAGGAVVAWEDHRGASRGDIYAQHVLGAGTLDSLWMAGGAPVSTGGPGKFAPMLASDGSGGAIVTWSDAVSQAVAGYFSARRALAEGLPQLLRAESNAGYARLVWTLGAAGGATIRGYRADADGAWETLASLSLDDSLHLVLEDRAAPQGREVEYRLSVTTAGAEYFLTPVRVTIPRAPVQLLLERVWTAPGRDAIQFAFALPPGPPARIDVFDVLGRQVAEASLAQFTPGYYMHRVAFRGRAVSGIYFVRLSQGGRTSSRRLSFLR